MQNQPSADHVRLTALVSGDVQGVGFRFATMGLARTMNLVGYAENLPDGTVEVVAEGPEADCGQLLAWLQGAGPRSVRRPGHVTFVHARSAPAQGGFRSFSYR